MKNRNALVGGACVLVLLAVVVIWTGSRSDDTPVPTPGLEAQPAGQSGMVTYIDPETGERTTTPTAEQADALGAEFDTSDEGLEVKPSPVAGGGYMVELNGKFQSSAVVTGDSVECLPDSQAAEAVQGGEK